MARIDWTSDKLPLEASASFETMSMGIGLLRTVTSERRVPVTMTSSRLSVAAMVGSDVAATAAATTINTELTLVFIVHRLLDRFLRWVLDTYA